MFFNCCFVILLKYFSHLLKEQEKCLVILWMQHNFSDVHVLILLLINEMLFFVHSFLGTTLMTRIKELQLEERWHLEILKSLC